MENTKRGAGLEILETVLKIAGLVVSLLSTIIKAIELVSKFRNQKSNRQSAQG